MPSVADEQLADSVATGIASAVVPSPLVIHGLDGLRDAVGTDLGTSRWVTIDQDLVNSFAEVTNDQQWIHIDPERAKSGPFGGTVAHGFLTMSLITTLLWDVAVVTGVNAEINYGLNKLRFPAPVKVGSRLRMHVTLTEVHEIKGGLETVYHLVYESEGSAKPPCVADLVWRYYLPDVRSLNC